MISLKFRYTRFDNYIVQAFFVRILLLALVLCNIYEGQAGLGSSAMWTAHFEYDVMGRESLRRLLGGEPLAISGHSCFIQHNLNPKFLSYFFCTEKFREQKKKFISGTKVRRVNASDLAKIIIPIPPIAEQERIVSILDKFDSLVNSISEGLPAEINLRQKQYEYYRSALLSFD